ncbi:type II toxin-antitoxin system HicB family antitoxin [Pseudaminobacter sp. 19-2017]|uniref:Type II toxin-antitoxin system HicB family antitoxin n=1 Tax=Pseudaminobacter soli (ex Zhang et al. 2022) TaxID=2831468 RepID=A0A942I3R6_9HYPH|nr:type II toxin-antitoxin system HicB family antitoxin [Pseudaminobacter soli]MBS3650748.1 type II toxin-antitoxin system HicB family antitoxin [Pseudaminobacter soli]
MRPYKGYSAEIWFEEDDAAFHGLVSGIRDTVHFQGRTPEELTEAFHDSVDDYLAFCAEQGKDPDKPYSGNLALRTTPEIHQMVGGAAASQGKSVNQWISDALEEVARKQLASGATRIRH